MVAIAYPFLISLAAALVVRDQAPKPLSFTLNKHDKKEKVRPNPTTRAKINANEDVKLFADGDSYLINLGVIDQNQELQLVLDTGSADLWVDAAKLLDTSAFTKDGQKFGIEYQDQLIVRGEFGTSSVWLENGVEIKDLQWALATDVELTTGEIPGILGIGKGINEAGYHSSGTTYPNFTQKLKDQGLIALNSYSYYLNKLGTATGTITFGGRDLAKVKGPVATFYPSTTDENARFDTVTVSKFTSANGGSAPGVEAILDTGTTLTYIPASVIKLLKVPGVSVDIRGTYYIGCNQPTTKFVSFWFGSTEIKVSYHDLAIPETDDNGNATGRCYFGFQSSTPEEGYTLGDSFLRGAYITVNHDKNQILISDVNFTDTENIVSI